MLTCRYSTRYKSISNINYTDPMVRHLDNNNLPTPNPVHIELAISLIQQYVCNCWFAIMNVYFSKYVMYVVAVTNPIDDEGFEVCLFKYTPDDKGHFHRSDITTEITYDDARLQ